VFTNPNKVKFICKYCLTLKERTPHVRQTDISLVSTACSREPEDTPIDKVAADCCLIISQASQEKWVEKNPKKSMSQNSTLPSFLPALSSSNLSIHVRALVNNLTNITNKCTK